MEWRRQISYWPPGGPMSGLPGVLLVSPTPQIWLGFRQQNAPNLVTAHEYPHFLSVPGGSRSCLSHWGGGVKRNPLKDIGQIQAFAPRSLPDFHPQAGDEENPFARHLTPPSSPRDPVAAVLALEPPPRGRARTRSAICRTAPVKPPRC